MGASHERGRSRLHLRVDWPCEVLGHLLSSWLRTGQHNLFALVKER
jgi:hypothetical protein